MRQTMQPLSIIVPTLNEADNLLLLFKRIDTTLRSVAIPYEIIVVDDHSTDDTTSIVKSAGSKYNVRLLMKQGKPGKAFSLLEGFAAAENELLCMIDGDLQYPPEAIKNMYHKMQYCEADIVVTERIENATGYLRRLSSAVFNLVFTRALFGIKYDTQSGLKLFRRRVLKTMSLSPSPWTFDLEFLVRALEQGYIVVSQEIPFSARHAGVPKVRLLGATYELAAGSLKLWRNSSTKRVKLHYRNLEVWERSFGKALLPVALVIIAASLVIAGGGQGLVSAQESSSAKPQSSSTTSTPQNSTTQQSPTSSTSQQPVSSGSQPFTNPTNFAITPTPINGVNAPLPILTPSSTTPLVVATSPASSSGSSSPVASHPSNTQHQPAASGAASPSPSSSSSSKAVAVANSLQPARSTSVRSSSNAGGFVAANPLATAPKVFPLAVASSATKYYPTTKLSHSTTETLLALAKRIVIVGALFLSLGSVIIVGKKLSGRLNRPLIRS